LNLTDRHILRKKRKKLVSLSLSFSFSKVTNIYRWAVLKRILHYTIICDSLDLLALNISWYAWDSACIGQQWSVSAYKWDIDYVQKRKPVIEAFCKISIKMCTLCNCFVLLALYVSNNLALSNRNSVIASFSWFFKWMYEEKKRIIFVRDTNKNFEPNFIVRYVMLV